MTIPKWVLPVVAVIAAVAVGVSMALLAARFAPQPVAEPTSEAPVQIVPVLEPIAVGDEQPAPAPTADEAAAAGDDGEGLIVSDVIAEREVAVPATPDEEEAEFVRLVDFMAEVPDGVLGLLGAGRPGLLPRDDACAPESGDPPAGCPAGLPGAIFPTVGLRPFYVSGYAYPQSYDEYLAEGNPYGLAMWCDDLDAGDGEVPFGIQATAPGSFSIVYWPTGDTAAGHRVSVASTPEQEAEWNEQVALGDEGLPIVRMCLTLPDILPDTAYTAMVVASDILDRRAPWHTSRFHSEGEPVHPGLQLTTVGDNLVFASAFASDDETVEIRAARLDPGEPATCAAADAGDYAPLSSVEVRADADEIAAVNALPGYRNKTVVTFAIPEGTAAIICARWFPGEAPSWERAQHVFESSAVVQAPDRLVPRVRLYEVHSYDDRVSEILVTTSSAEGTVCGQTNWQAGDPGPFPREICRPGFLASGDVEVDEAAGHISTRYFSGDLVIEAETRLGTGESSTTSYLIPAGEGACRGDCETPWSRWYRVALADIEQGIGLCGSSFGASCTPPTTTVTTGALMVRVSWEQGDSNGFAEWQVGATTDRPVDYVAPDDAQLDDQGSATGGWTLSEPTVASPYSDAALLLNVDRPVTFRVALQPYASLTDSEFVGCTGLPLEASGRSVDRGGALEISARIPGLCLGTAYFGTIELTDESGRTTTYGFDRATTELWAGGFLQTPRLLVDVVYDVQAQGIARSYLAQFEVKVNGWNLGVVHPGVNRCDDDGVHQSEGSMSGVAVLDEMLVVAEVRVTRSVRWGSADPWGVDCFGDPDDDAPARAAFFEVTLDELMNPYGVVLSSPDVPGLQIKLNGYSPRASFDR